MANSAKPTLAGMKASDAQIFCLAEVTGYKNPTLARNRAGEEVVTGVDPTNGQRAGGEISRGPPDPSVQGPYGSIAVKNSGAQISVEAVDPNAFGPSYDLTINTNTGAPVAAKGLPGANEQRAIMMAQHARDCFKP